MNENDIAREIVDAAFKIHSALGPGLVESVYEAILAHELKKRGLDAQRQVPIRLQWDGLLFDEAFRADLVVEEKVIVELKALEVVPAIAKSKLLTYLRLADKRLGLLLNFGDRFIKDGITRVVNGLEE